ncbi:MAG: RHS repeat protein [Arenicella sp.]|nr:RHS repeat protein [Arenicella sp.]
MTILTKTNKSGGERLLALFSSRVTDKKVSSYFLNKTINGVFILISSIVMSLPVAAQTTVIVDKERTWGTPDTGPCHPDFSADPKATQEALCDEIFACELSLLDPSSIWPCNGGHEGPCLIRPQNPQESGGFCLLTGVDGTGSGGQFSRAFSSIDCAEGTVAYGASSCIKTIDTAKDIGCGNGQSLSSNPCNIATGNKLRREVDISGQGMNLTRFYNSQDLVDTGIGIGWRVPYRKSLNVYIDSLEVVGSSGRRELWRKVSNVWGGDNDSDVIITETASEFTLTKSNGSQQNYDEQGVLKSEVDTNGSTTNYAYYANGELQSVTNTYGHSLNFVYADNRIASIEDQLGNIYRYTYDAVGNLNRVTFPDVTPIDSDNPFKTYHYDDTNNPNLLTGITDENGDRYATFAYNANGQAILSELGTTTNNVGQGKIELDFQAGAQ